MKNTTTKHRTSGFTLIELIVVIALISILATIAFTVFSSEGAKDRKREARLGTAQTLLQDFYSKYGEFPSSSGKGKKYPTTGCSVSGWKTMVDCFAADGLLVKDSEDYNQLLLDPSDGTSPQDSDLVFGYQYCVNAKANKYRIFAVAGKQDNPEYTWVDGKPAEKGKRVINKVSSGTKMDEITSCAQ
jgi:prepilin-type N-terminal cleavage/methylation domain-containing protein